MWTLNFDMGSLELEDMSHEAKAKMTSVAKLLSRHPALRIRRQNGDCCAGFGQCHTALLRC